MRDIAAVVVTYNRCELLRRNIECLLNQKGAECDIYIIDNASTDGTRGMVEGFADSRIHYFNTGSNLGGAGGFEFGTRQAAEDGYRFIWLMDDDTLPSDTALYEFLKADKALRGEWGALSSVSYWIDGSLGSGVQKPTLFTHVRAQDIASKALIKIVQAPFVSLLVKSEIIRQLGLPIGEYFIWTDDFEFTGRISRKHNMYVVTASKVVHAMKDNRRPNFALETSRERINRYRYMYRNDVHCYRQYGLKGWAYLAAKFLYTVANILINSKTDKLAKIRVVIRGYREGLSFNPEVRRITHGGGGHCLYRLTVTVIIWPETHYQSQELEAAA